MNKATSLILILCCSYVFGENCKPGFSTDRSAYIIGESPTYTISCAEPGKNLLWSSLKNNIPTGENMVFYGQRTDPSGNWIAQGGKLTASDIGFWEKNVIVGDTTLKVFFVVVETLTPQTPASKDGIGVAHIGGKYRFTNEPFLVEGARQISELGSRNIAIQMSPRYATEDYPDKSEIYGSAPIRNLTDLAKTEPFAKLFEMPWKVIAINAFTFTNWDWMNGVFDFDSSRENRETSELYDLTRHLMLTYMGSGKTFILKTWESDWLADRSYDPRIFPDQTRIQNMIRFFNARHRGIEKARNELSWVQGVKVIDAVEFNLLNRVRSGTPSVLNNIIPSAQCDAIAYSSWDTMAKAIFTEENGFKRAILDDIAFIRNFPGINGKQLFVSEYGFTSTAPKWNTSVATTAFLDAGIPNAWFWEIYDNPGGDGFGLVRPDGSRSPIHTTLREFLEGDYFKSSDAVLWAPTCTGNNGPCSTVIHYDIEQKDKQFYIWTNGNASWQLSPISGRGELTLILQPNQRTTVKIFYWDGGCEWCGRNIDIAGIELSPTHN